MKIKIFDKIKYKSIYKYKYILVVPWTVNVNSIDPYRERNGLFTTVPSRHFYGR